MSGVPVDLWSAEAAADAAAVVRAALGDVHPQVAIILGSGLGSAAGRIVGARELAYSDIPGFASPSVIGHAGRLIAGRLSGRSVVAFAGRFHMYEGHAPRVSAFPVRVAHALGARVLFASNASGGLNPEFVPGDLVLIEDQLNLTGQNPLTGPLQRGDLRFPDMSAPYSRRLRALVRSAAEHANVPLRCGVYAGLLGPAYETPSEVRMLQRLGADLTGMSTVAEAIVASAIGMEMVAVSLVTNAGAGLTDALVSHDDVVIAAEKASDGFARLLEEFVARL